MHMYVDENSSPSEFIMRCKKCLVGGGGRQGVWGGLGGTSK